MQLRETSKIISTLLGAAIFSVFIGWLFWNMLELDIPSFIEKPFHPESYGTRHWTNRIKYLQNRMKFNEDEIVNCLSKIEILNAKRKLNEAEVITEGQIFDRNPQIVSERVKIIHLEYQMEKDILRQRIEMMQKELVQNKREVVRAKAELARCQKMK